jgi:transcriptional regulator with XRE-family HTH domain
MPPKERPADIGRRRARRIALRLGEELLSARQEHGLSQQSVARAAGISRCQVSRIERGLVPQVSMDPISRLLTVVGLELIAKAYPAGQPIRDAAHLRLARGFDSILPPAVRPVHEVPLPGAGELRCWDEWIELDQDRVAVEFETQPRDVQSLLRRVASKLRDDPRVSRVLLVLAETRHNRRLLADFGGLLAADFPACSDEVLGDLRQGRLPSRSGLLMLGRSVEPRRLRSPDARARRRVELPPDARVWRGAEIRSCWAGPQIAGPPQ